MTRTLPAAPTAPGPSPAAGETLVAAMVRTAARGGGMRFRGPRGDLLAELGYPELVEAADDIAARLLARGLAPGDRVGLVAETEADFVRAFMGCMVARLVPCPMPLPAAFGQRAAYAEQIRRIAGVADIAAVVVAAPYRAMVAEALEDRRLVFVGAPGDLGEARASLPAGTPRPDDIAYLQFSSGTTRTPKGVAITHRALMANIAGMAGPALDIGPGDRGVSWLPFYHDMGLVGSLLLPIATGVSMDYLATRDFIRRPGRGSP